MKRMKTIQASTHSITERLEVLNEIKYSLQKLAGDAESIDEFKLSEELSSCLPEVYACIRSLKSVNSK